MPTSNQPRHHQPRHLPVPPGDTGLFTDFYELTMAQSYFAEGMDGNATFSLYVREYPPDRGYLIAAGVDDALDCLTALRFDDAAIAYLSDTGAFAPDFLAWLRNFRFTGHARAMPEGSIFFTHEPVLEVTAPIIAAQLAETVLVNRIQFQTLLATKSARCVHAAAGRPLADFAARRTHGAEAALAMARSSYLAGFAATSNALAARRYGIPPTGTMAHSYITAFPREIDAFRAYARAFPDRCTLLLDTYDTINAARLAATVAHEMADAGHRLAAVRLDSGDFDALSRQVRRILDDAGLDYVRIVASGGLDEYELQRLVQAGAPIDLFGIGTRVGVSGDAPWCDLVYKMVAYQGRPVMKLSAGKTSLPGAKQVYRHYDHNGMMAGDVIALADETITAGTPLLTPAVANGYRITPPGSPPVSLTGSLPGSLPASPPGSLDASPTGSLPNSPPGSLDASLPGSLAEARQRVADSLSTLPAAHRRLRSPAPYPVSPSPAVTQLERQIRAAITTGHPAAADDN